MVVARRRSSRADSSGVREFRVIDHPSSSWKGVRSAALVDSRAEKRTSAPTIAATQSAMDSMTKAAKQAAELADANVQAVADAVTNAFKSTKRK